MNSQNDKVKGSFNSTVGAVKQAAGKVINDPALENRGLVQKDKGNTQKTRGALEDKFEKGSRAVGKVIEKAGNKISHLAD